MGVVWLAFWNGAWEGAPVVVEVPGRATTADSAVYAATVIDAARYVATVTTSAVGRATVEDE